MTTPNRWTTAAGYEGIIAMYGYDDVKWPNGYVALPPDHPWSGCQYQQGVLDDLTPNPVFREVPSMLGGTLRVWDGTRPESILECHGGVTWTGVIESYSPLWLFGFDTNHLDDELNGSRNIRYVTDNVESLAAQLKLVEECNTLSELIAKLEEMR